MANLFPNPSVETDLTSFGFGWGTASGQRTTDEALDGIYSIEVTSNDGGWITDAIAALPLTQYTFSIYAQGSGSVQCGWRAADAAFNQLDSFAFGSATVLTGAWQQIPVTFTTTNVLTAYVLLIAYNVTAGSRVWYSDWHQLETTAAATPYPSGLSTAARLRRSNFELRPAY
jgi:hypothetical protein